VHVESPAGNKRKPSSPDLGIPRKEKKAKEDAGRPVPGPLPTASAKYSAEQRRIADSELEAKSVELLVLDQIIPKKAKDGAARLFGKTAQGSSVVVSISGFRVSVGAKGEGEWVKGVACARADASKPLMALVSSRTSSFPHQRAETVRH